MIGCVTMSIREEHLIDLLQAKYREDPKGFRKYLPGAAELLPEQPTRRSRPKSPFGLTEMELSYRKEGLAEVLCRLDEGTLTPGDALTGLQHCATLIRDNNLQYGWDEVLSHEMGYEVLKSLLTVAIGKSPGSYKSKTTVPVGEGDSPIVEQVSVIKGVRLGLDINRRLVSVSIHPGEYRERRKLMAIVGIGSDTSSDVALRHDDYLAMQEFHGHNA